MLDARRNRTTMSRIGWASVAGMALALSLPIAALSLTAPVAQTAVDLSQDPLATAPPATPAPTAAPMPQPKTAASASTRQTATITGQVVDQSGGAIPGAKATLANSQGGDERTAISNASGRYTFDGLPPAEYQLTVQLVGFRSARVVTQAGPGARVETPVTLQIGGLVETINVRCSSSFSILDALFPVLHAQTPIRIGGQIHAPRVITRVSPVCPAGAVTENTIVIAEGVIGADGAIDSLKILRPQTDALDDAVLKALPQWRFTPTLLNGRPVEVTITVTVNFQVS